MRDEGTNFYPGINLGFEQAKKTEKHAIVYIALTDGCLGGIGESVAKAEEIKRSAKPNFPAPVFYMCAFGNSVSLPQLQQIV